MPNDYPIVYHFPPDVFNVLVDLLPRLNKSKRDVVTFFRSAGVPADLYRDLEAQLRADRDSIGKKEIVHTIISRLNERGDALLGARREIIKRAVEFDSYESCWDTDRLPARGLVSQLRDLVNAKDTFTRLRDVHAAEVQKNRALADAELRQAAIKRAERDRIKKELYSLFAISDPYKRAPQFELTLSELFRHFEILIREPFKATVNGETIEQIDGAIEIDGRFFLVEVKWHKEPIGKEKAATHLVRVYQRHDANGLLISASGFTTAVVEDHKIALSQRVVLMCHLDEIVHLLDRADDLKAMLKKKVAAAIADKNPYLRVLG